MRSLTGFHPLRALFALGHLGRSSDPVDVQLRELERQGRGMARLGHIAAFALAVVFSLGSLVALSGEALSRLLVEWQHGAVDVPAAISIAVSALLVAAMDIALVVAAANVRMLRLRRQEGAAIHITVIVGVSLVEAGTYLYMSASYDRPDNAAVWALIIARALSAPLTAVYLSLARTLPVSARDILAQVELATGRGVVRNMVEIAADPHAALERKLALYGASSVMTADDRARLDALITIERETREAQAIQAASPATPTLDAQPAAGIEANATPNHDTEQAPASPPSPLASMSTGASESISAPPMPDPLIPPVTSDSAATTHGDDRPPTGGGSPTFASKRTTPTSHATQSGQTTQPMPGAANVTPLRRGLGNAPRRDRRTANRANARSGHRGRAEQRIRDVLAQEPDIAPEMLAIRAQVSLSTVSKWLAVIAAERASDSERQSRRPLAQ